MREFSFLAIKFLRREEILRAPRNQHKKKEKTQKVSSEFPSLKCKSVCSRGSPAGGADWQQLDDDDDDDDG